MIEHLLTPLISTRFLEDDITETGICESSIL